MDSVHVIIMMTFLQTLVGEPQKFPVEEAANITSFDNHKGLYYQYLGTMKTSNSEWKLINYLDLDQYSTKYLTLSKLYNSTSQLCAEIRQKLESNDSIYICQLFSQATLPYLYEIEINHRNILSSIGQSVNTNDRIRRGLRNAISRLASVLYGNIENMDMEFIFSKIAQLAYTNKNNLNLVPEQIRIIQTKITENDSALTKALTNQQKLEQNIQVLSEQIKRNTQNIDKIMVRTTLLEQTVLFEVMLNQYAYETQNLIEIVNAALNGKLHTTILSTRKWLTELREIKINLPVGTALPLEITQEAIPDFIKLSEVTIFHKDKYLVFVIKIPLVYSNEFTVYNIIPLPMEYDSKSLVLIEPEIEILAISRDKENFFGLTNRQWETCEELKTYTLCKNSQSIHYRIRTNLCEIALLLNPQNFPNNCKIKFVTSNVVIWNQLSYSNSWLFYTLPEMITVDCINPNRAFSFKIFGIGRLTISSTCKLHTERSLLLPSNHAKSNTYLDIIPENPKFNIKQSFEDLLNLAVPQNFSNVQIVKDLIKFSQNLQDLENLRKNPTDPPFIKVFDVHIIVIYVLIIFGIILSIFVLFKIKKKNVKLYEPDLPETDLQQNE